VNIFYKHIAIDQWGNIYKLKTKYPRKELMEIHDAKHADKMYQAINGENVHVGYVIRGAWLHIYRIANIVVNGRSF
jgi:hypothetical protein